MEDGFDGANRRNLRHFIISQSPDHDEKVEEGTDDQQTDDQHESAVEVEEAENATPAPVTYYMAEDDGRMSGQLASLPILAVFHKFASGKGIPHTFVGFLRQYPALPRVVVRINHCHCLG